VEHIKCIFCDIESNNVIIEENGYQGKKCPHCGLIYISPRPPFEEICNIYFYDQANKSADSHISAGYTKRIYGKHTLAIIKKYISKGSLLEIGAGGGFFLDEARKAGFDVYAIESNAIQADFIKGTLKIPCEQTPIGQNSFNGKKFNVIYHCDVLSHFYDPVQELKKMYDRLDNNGILVFETGNLADVNRKYFHFVPIFQYPDHLFFFGKRSISSLLENTGFKMIGQKEYSIVPQLLFINTISALRKKPGKKASSNSKSSSNLNGKSSNAKNYKSWIVKLYGIADYMIRYKVGNIVPKKGRPQTVIVFAKKI
jgi:2-polyprenyl-3-methyl-5-hydroxy-6-metoxy-1,4-benzoquinol methylase